MKAISIKQPWANLIAQGVKTIETRSWRTNYRGDILIVSSRNPDIYPAGVAVCIAEIYDCRKMLSEDESLAGVKHDNNKYSWLLRNVRPVKIFPARGMPGIYEVKNDLLAFIPGEPQRG
jgi:hypothetical protein